MIDDCSTIDNTAILFVDDSDALNGSYCLIHHVTVLLINKAIGLFKFSLRSIS